MHIYTSHYGSNKQKQNSATNISSLYTGMENCVNIEVSKVEKLTLTACCLLVICCELRRLRK